MAEMKAGYKQTDIGVIPEDWDVDFLLNKVSLIHGKAHEKEIYEGGKYTVVNSKFVSSDGKVKKYSQVNHCPAKIGDVLMVLSDLPNGKALAKCFHVNENDRYAVNQRVCIYRVKAIDSEYLYYVLNRNKYFLALDDGVTQTHILNNDIKKCYFQFPRSSDEQKQIAAALSDVDRLIESLERLIAKKRDMKAAAMQQLLTGQKRLPGFDGEWEELTLGDVCSEINDGTHYTPTYVPEGVPFYSVENVTANDFVNVKYITQEEHNLLIKRCRPEKGDILLTRIGSIGDTRLIDWDVDASIYVSLALLKTNQKAESAYVYEYTKSSFFIKDIEARSLLNATPKKINMGDIKGVPIKCPKSRDEQLTIAKILSDMRAEIDTLEQHLEKARSLKTGMMQELLTGKTRFIEKVKKKEIAV